MKKPSARPAVLHVVERPTEANSELDQGIARAGFDVEHVETVYGAMARLVRPDHLVIKAVVVCVDALEASELAFFTLAAGRWPGIPLYVYGQSKHNLHRHRALALGAASEIAENRVTDVLAELLRQAPVEKPAAPALSPAPASRIEEPAAEPARAEAEAVESIREEVEPLAEAGQPGSVVETELEELGRQFDVLQAKLSKGAKVPTPWQPAADRPRRIPPGARTGSAGGGERDEEGGLNTEQPPADPTQSPVRPLLSRQEVDALLDDAGIGDAGIEATDDEQA